MSLTAMPEYWCEKCGREWFKKILPAGWEHVLTYDANREVERYILCCPDCLKELMDYFSQVPERPERCPNCNAKLGALAGVSNGSEPRWFCCVDCAFNPEGCDCYRKELGVVR